MEIQNNNSTDSYITLKAFEHDSQTHVYVYIFVAESDQSKYEKL